MKNYFNFTNSIILIVILLVGYFVYAKYSTIKQEYEPVNVIAKSTDHSIGKSDAKVNIVEYGDFQCPACKAYDPVISEVVNDYIAKGADVKFTFKHFPLISIHNNAMMAAIGAEAAALQGKFWEYKKLVYENQESWAPGLDAKDKITALLGAVGIDSSKWTADLSNESLQTIVTDSMKEAIDLRLGGTPTVIINGIKVDLSQISTTEKLRAYIDKELAK